MGRRKMAIPHARETLKPGERRIRYELGERTIDDFDPVEEAPDEDPDDRLFAAGFLMVDLEV